MKRSRTETPTLPQAPAVPPILLLSSSDVRQAVTMNEAMECQQSAFELLFQKKASVPHRGIIDTAQGQTLFMPGSSLILSSSYTTSIR